MGIRRLTKSVNCLHCSIHCSIETDRIISICDIQIDRSGNTNNINTKLGKILSSGKGSVTTDYNQCIDSHLLEDLCRLLLSLYLTEFCAPCGEQKCTAVLQLLRNILKS